MTERNAGEESLMLREKIIGHLFNTLTHKALREVTRGIIAPLIASAPVAQKYKDRALSVPPPGVHPNEFEQGNEEVTDALANLIDAGAITLNARGAYESVGTAPPEPNTAEAVKHADAILQGWPEAARSRIISVLEGE